MNKEGILLVLSGFSGAGKDTVLRRLLEKGNFWLSVSATSRAPRGQEVDGEDYFFISREEFEQKIAEGGFLEHAEYSGNYYGTPSEKVFAAMAQGKDVILEIESNGALQIREKYPQAVLVFICAPSMQVLEQRLRSRGTETEEQIRKRMANSLREINIIDRYDYLLVNDDLDQCVEALRGIVQSEKEKAVRQSALINALRLEGEISKKA